MVNRNKANEMVRSISGWTNSPYVCYRVVGKNTPKGKVPFEALESPAANLSQVTSSH